MKLNQFEIGLSPKFKMEGEDGDFGGDGNVVLDTLEEGGGEGEESGDVTPPVTPPPFDAAAFAKTFGAEIGEHMKSLAPQQQQKQITPEEAMKMLNYWEPDDNWFQQFGNIETQKQAITAMRDGLTKQFVTILQSFVKDREEQIHGKYEPVLKWQQQQEVQAREARFDKKYNQLSDPNLKPVVYAVIQHLAQGGQLTGKDENKDFEAIAKGVEAIIQKSNPNFKLEASASGTKANQNKGNASRIPVTSHGSGGGGAGQPGSGVKKTGNVVLNTL